MIKLMSTKVKAFFHIFGNSLIPKASYYHKIVKTRVSLSLKYFFFLIVFLNVMLLFLFSLKLNPLRINIVLTSLINSLNDFPPEMIIDVKKGNLATNHNRPYFLWLDYQKAKHLILVIDETAMPQKIKEYNSLILITNKEIVFKDEKKPQGYTSTSHKLVNDQTISKETVNKVQATLVNINRLLLLTYPVGLILGVVLMTAVSLVSNVFYLLIASLTIFVFYKFIFAKKAKPEFVKITQISLHSVTLPLTLNYLYGVLNFRPQLLSGLFLLLVTLFTAVGVYEGYSHDLPRPHKIQRKK